jgi:hypothetical protein
MANVTIDGLPPVASTNDSDVFETSQGGISRKATKAQILSGDPTFNSVSDAKGELRRIPQNAQTAAYVLVATDAGKHISITTGGVTINTGVFSVGDAISIYNNSASNQIITQGAGVTMYLVGTATTGNRTLAQRGLASILCVGTNTFVISGGGLT